MHLRDILQPVGLDDFKDRFVGRQCLLIKRKRNPFEGLLTLDEIEARLNDGVASLDGLSVIQPNGIKLPPDELRRRQSGPAWATSFRDKVRVKNALAEGCSVVLHNMSAINRRVECLLGEIEELLPSTQADLHIYISPRASSTGYQVHKDEPQHKIYVQLLGSTRWIVFKGTDERRALTMKEARSKFAVDFEATLTPGSVLYMPPGVYHHATNPNGPRVSLSIPFYPSQGTIAVDRTGIDLATFFEAAAAPDPGSARNRQTP